MLARRLLLALLSVVSAALAGCQPSPPPAACPPPAASPWSSFTLASKALGETRTINVSTPPDYERDPGARFAVLYMPDGGVEEDFVHVVDTVRALAAYGNARPLIVVGVENTERRRDMTGPTASAEDRKIAPRVGGSAAFRAFFRDELMPYVRARYRTTGESAIVGESLAGLFVLETFFLEPALFDAYVAISPSVWWNDGQLVRESAGRLSAWPGLRKTLYLTSADEENIVPGVARLAEGLRAAAPPGLTWFYQPMPDQYHDTIYRAASPKAFRTVFAPPAKPAAGR
jgi:predicted alpha/beta superfamily hydrolase